MINMSMLGGEYSAAIKCSAFDQRIKKSGKKLNNLAALIKFSINTL